MDNVKFRFSILFFFILLEVILFNRLNQLQFILSMLEYFFVLICYIKDKKVGIMYFISFTLLSMGEWSYVIYETPPLNFYGIRLFGVSLNILFSIFLFLDLVLSKNKKLKDLNFIKKSKIFFIYIFFIFIIGLYNLMISTNYLDNFISDVFTYIPFIIYIYLISIIDKKSLIIMIKYGVSITIISFVLSVIFDSKFEYAENQSFLLMNAFSFIVPFLVFFMGGVYNKKLYYTQILIVILLLISGNLFIGGKFIIIFAITVFWLISKTKQRVYIYSLIILFLFFSKPIFDSIKENFSSNPTISWKIQQIEEGLLALNSGNLELEGSFGNIINEGAAILSYFKEEEVPFFTGMGMGGGVPDKNNTLAPLAGNSGYSFIDRERNNYFTMHISILDVFLKAGIVWLVLFMLLLIKQFKYNDVYGFICFILLFTVFYTSKEMMLLTVLFFSLSSKYKEIHEKSVVYTE